MKSLKNQDGFALLEVILFAGVVSVLVTIALPEVFRVIDKVALNYETRKILSELNFADSAGRLSGVDVEFFNYGRLANNSGKNVYFRIKKISNSYQVDRNGKIIRPVHTLPDGFKIDFNNSSLETISFGRHTSTASGTISLTSRLGDRAEIIFDSVGRRRLAHDSTKK